MNFRPVDVVATAAAAIAFVLGVCVSLCLSAWRAGFVCARTHSHKSFL